MVFGFILIDSKSGFFKEPLVALVAFQFPLLQTNRF